MNNTIILNVIYHKCLFQSLKGNLEQSKLYFSMIQEYAKTSENRKALKSFLTKERYNQLQKIKKQIEIGKTYEEFEPITPIENSIEPTETDLAKEKELVKLTCRNMYLLEKFLGNELKGRGIEVETYLTGGKCDMVVQDNDRTLFPIEFKLNKATHAVVSQIDKYCLHFNLRLMNNMYDKVQGVVIASSFSKYAINSLLKRGIICLQYSCENDDLKLTKITVNNTPQ